MSDQTTTFGDRLAKIVRALLLAAIAAVVVLIILGPKNHGLPNPLAVGRAGADGGLAAAPGYIILPMMTGHASKFYLCDTNKQVICVYETRGDMLRLVSARKFDKDVGIFDASITVGGGIEKPEGHLPGLSREEADRYAEAIKTFRERAEKKK
jgi:hypothetical protein